MKNLILAAVAVVTLSFATSNAMARNRHAYHHRGRVHHHVVPYHAYRHVPVYSGHAYHVPRNYHNYHHGYHYAHPGYSSGGIGVNGRHFSLYIGF